MFQILFTVTYTSVAYYLSSQPLEMERYSMVQCILILVALCASGLGFALGTVVNPIVRNRSKTVKNFVKIIHF